MRRARPRRFLVVNPTLQLAVAVDVSTRGVGRRRLELTDPRAVRFLLAASTRLYRGDRVRHWRHPQRRGHTTVLASLHYGSPRASG